MTDQDANGSLGEEHLQGVMAKINELASKAAAGNYLYRGENDHYPEVSSGLRRAYAKIDPNQFDLNVVQSEHLQIAKRFVKEQADDSETLTELQHYGYPTNFIDFTTDFHIALFFACDGEPGKNGRVILLDKGTYKLMEPKAPENRIIAQKSVFVQSPKGYVEPEGTVVIPWDLKNPILEYLRTCHGVMDSTIYNDIHGFIKVQKLHKDAYTEFHYGIADAEAGDYDKAIERYSRSIELNEHQPGSYYNRGLSYGRKGEFDRAIRDFTRAIELDPDYAEAHINRGIARSAGGDYAHGIRDFSRAIELNPNDVEAYSNRGLSYVDIGDYSRGIHDFKTAIELDASHVLAYYGRGIAYWRMEDFDQSIEDFTRAIELDPDNAAIYYGRGLSYWGKGDYANAIRDFSRAIDLNPNDANAYYGRGANFMITHSWENAQSDFSAAKDLGFDIGFQFDRDFGSITNYEDKHKVRLPDEIATMLNAR